MKKSLKIYILFFMLVFFAGTLSACSFFNLMNPVYSITFTDAEITMVVGESVTPELTVSPVKYSGSLAFASSDETVATVDGDGAITAKAEGTATISVSCDTSSATASIIVNVAYADLTSLLISVNEADLSQIYEDGVSPKSVTFNLTLTYGINPAELDNIIWVIKKESNNSTVKTGSGTSIYYTPSVLGESYIVTASYENAEAEISLSDHKHFGWFRPMDSIVLSASTTATMGVAQIISAALAPTGVDPNSKLDWYVKIGGGSYALDETAAAPYNYVPETYGSYSVYAKFKNFDDEIITSNIVSFSAGYAAIDDVEISASKYSILKDTPLILTLTWNKQYNDPATVYSIEWYVDSVLQSGQTGETFSFSSSTDGSYVICAEVNNIASNNVTVVVKDKYPAISEIEVVSNQTGLMASPYSAVTYTASISPAGSDPYAEVDWYINGTLQTTGVTGNTFVHTPAASAEEYHVQAVIGCVKSNTVTTITKSSSSSTDTYLSDNYHTYGGYPQNRYITSQEEMNNIIAYVRETRKASISIYVDYDPTVPVLAQSGTSKLGKTFAAFVESGVTPTVSGELGVYTNESITLNFNYSGAAVASPSTSTVANGINQSGYVVPYESATGRASGAQLYIDGQTDTMLALNTNMLYKIVGWGYQPTFNSTADSLAAHTVYTAANSVLHEIIDDGMTELQKVNAIYDWICFNVVYDYTLADMVVDTNTSMTYDGYYLEGVFTNHKAVCDGKSKAFVLLCGMEGIDAVRITGIAGTSSNQSEWGGHAWNKVLIDADDDGEKEWYVVDATWGDTSYLDGGVTKELLTRKYFLLCDSEISGTHTEDEDRGEIPAAADNGFNYYNSAVFTYSGTEYNYYITSMSEMTVAKNYADSKGWSGIEVRVASTAYLVGCSYYNLYDSVYVIINI